jgi:predicted DNA-binding protein
MYNLNVYFINSEGVFKMDRTQIYLTPEQKEALLDLSKNTSTSMAELIRLAIDEYLSKRSQDNRLQAIQETFGAIPEWVGFTIPPLL